MKTNNYNTGKTPEPHGFRNKSLEFFKKLRIQVFLMLGIILIDVIIFIIYSISSDKNPIYIFYVTMVLVSITLISLWINKVKELPIIWIILSYFFAILLPGFLVTVVLTSWQDGTLKNYTYNFLLISFIALIIHLICLCFEIKIAKEIEVRIEILEKLKVASSFAIPLAAFLALLIALFVNIKNFDSLLKPALFIISLLGVYRGLIEWMLYSQNKKRKDEINKKNSESKM